MSRTERYWRTVAIAALLAVAFLLGRSTAPAEAFARSTLSSASEITTNDEGDVLWVYDFDSTARVWNVVRVDYDKGEAELKEISHPRGRSF